MKWKSMTRYGSMDELSYFLPVKDTVCFSIYNYYKLKQFPVYEGSLAVIFNHHWLHIIVWLHGLPISQFMFYFININGFMFCIIFYLSCHHVVLSCNLINFIINYRWLLLYTVRYVCSPIYCLKCVCFTHVVGLITFPS